MGDSETVVLTADDVARIVSEVGLDRFMDRMIETLGAALASPVAADSLIPRRGIPLRGTPPGVIEWMPHLQADVGTMKLVSYSPGNHRRELARLFASGAECDPAIDHYANRPCRHDKENDDDCLGHPAHLFPQVDRVPSDAAGIFLEEPKGQHMRFGQRESCNVCYKHEFMFSSSETFRTFCRERAPSSGSRAGTEKQRAYRTRWNFFILGSRTASVGPAAPTKSKKPSTYGTGP